MFNMYNTAKEKAWDTYDLIHTFLSECLPEEYFIEEWARLTKLYTDTWEHFNSECEFLWSMHIHLWHALLALCMYPIDTITDYVCSILQNQKISKTINKRLKILKNIFSRIKDDYPLLKRSLIHFGCKILFNALEFSDIFQIYKTDYTIDMALFFAFIKLGLDIFIHCSLALGCFHFGFFIINFPECFSYIHMLCCYMHIEIYYDILKYHAIFGYAKKLHTLFIENYKKFFTVTTKKPTLSIPQTEKRTVYCFFLDILHNIFILNCIEPLLFCISCYSPLPVYITIIKIILLGISSYYINIITDYTVNIIIHAIRQFIQYLGTCPFLRPTIETIDKIVIRILEIIYALPFQGFLEPTKIDSNRTTFHNSASLANHDATPLVLAQILHSPLIQKGIMAQHLTYARERQIVDLQFQHTDITNYPRTRPGRKSYAVRLSNRE